MRQSGTLSVNPVMTIWSPAAGAVAIAGTLAAVSAVAPVARVVVRTTFVLRQFGT